MFRPLARMLFLSISSSLQLFGCGLYSGILFYGCGHKDLKNTNDSHYQHDYLMVTNIPNDNILSSCAEFRDYSQCD